MTTYTRFIISGRDGYEWNDTTDTETGQDGPKRVNTLTIGDTWLTIRGPVSTLRLPVRDVEQIITWNDAEQPDTGNDVAAQPSCQSWSAGAGNGTGPWACSRRYRHQGRHVTKDGQRFDDKGMPEGEACMYVNPAIPGMLCYSVKGHQNMHAHEGTRWE